MIGTWKWNAALAGAVMALTFLLSLSNNVLTTALARGLYAFLLAYVMTYVFRWVLGTVAGLKHFGELAEGANDADTESTGQLIDFSTPPDSVLDDILHDQSNEIRDVSEFSPLEPPKFVSKEKIDPEKLANSLRQLSEE